MLEKRLRVKWWSSMTERMTSSNAILSTSADASGVTSRVACLSPNWASPISDPDPLPSSCAHGLRRSDAPFVVYRRAIYYQHIKSRMNCCQPAFEYDEKPGFWNAMCQRADSKTSSEPKANNYWEYMSINMVCSFMHCSLITDTHPTQGRTWSPK
jgi:hypothetical protein